MNITPSAFVKSYTLRALQEALPFLLTAIKRMFAQGTTIGFTEGLIDGNKCIHVEENNALVVLTKDKDKILIYECCDLNEVLEDIEYPDLEIRMQYSLFDNHQIIFNEDGIESILITLDIIWEKYSS